MAYKIYLNEFMTYAAYSVLMFFFGFMASADWAFMLPAIILGGFFLWWKFENKQQPMRWKPT